MFEVTLPYLGDVPMTTAQDALIEFVAVNAIAFFVLAIWAIYKSYRRD